MADLASATATAMQLIPCSAAAVLVARAVAVVAGALVTARATTLLLFNKPHFRGLCALARSGRFCSSPCGGSMCCLSMRRAFVLATCCDYAMASGCPKVRGRRLHAHTSFTPPSHRPPAPSLCKRLRAECPPIKAFAQVYRYIKEHFHKSARPMAWSRHGIRHRGARSRHFRVGERPVRACVS